jgi:hypothetical protein
MKNLLQQIEHLNNQSKLQEAAKLAVNALGVKIKKEWLKYDYHFAGDKVQRHIFKVKIAKNGRSFSVNFGQSIKEDAKEPSNYDILACLQKNEVGTFENFCGDFGYGEDSRKAEKIYKAVCKEFANMQKLFSDEELEILALIQ